MAISTGVYQYTSDTGVVYQVALPSDFAAALDMTVASGSEPYLPQIISPRYATYVSNSPLSYRQAVVSTLQELSFLPASLNVNGINYLLKSFVGESIPATTFPQLAVAAGPQGPPGAEGPMPSISTQQITGDATLSAGGWQCLVVTANCTLTLPSSSTSAGTVYLISCRAAGPVNFAFVDGADSVAGPSLQGPIGGNCSLILVPTNLGGGIYFWTIIATGMGLCDLEPDLTQLGFFGLINHVPVTAPPNPSSGFWLYVDSADGKLKAQSSAGTITVLALP